MHLPRTVQYVDFFCWLALLIDWLGIIHLAHWRARAGYRALSYPEQGSGGLFWPLFSFETILEYVKVD